MTIQIKKETETKWTCDVCYETYCLKCLDPITKTPVLYHDKLTCEEFQKKLGEKKNDFLFRDYIEEYKKTVITQNCPGCSLVTDKLPHTCNHATCIYCHLHFCWKCGYHANNYRDGNEIYTHMNNKHNGIYD